MPLPDHWPHRNPGSLTDCLLACSQRQPRATPCTVEAISVDPPGTRTPA